MFLRHQWRMPDWEHWHRAYEDPSSSLSMRLAVVRAHVARLLNDPRSPSARVLSLCAGEGRDLLPPLSECTVAPESVVLVENNPMLAQTARTFAAEHRLGMVNVVTADASDPAQYPSAYPADLLLLCGIFGNISDGDVKTLIAAAPNLLRERGTVIWTRGWTDRDLRPSIRRWFSEAGLHEVVL